MDQPRPAELSERQLQSLREMEQRLGCVLVAYEPGPGQGGPGGEEPKLGSVMDGIQDTYRTADPD